MDCLDGGFVFLCFGALGFSLSSAKGGVLILRSASVGTECFAILRLIVGLVGFSASSVGTERRSLGIVGLLRISVLSVGTERHFMGVVQVLCFVARSVGTEPRSAGSVSANIFNCPSSVSSTLLSGSLAPVGTDCCDDEWGKGLGLLGFFLFGERGGVGGGGLSEGLPRYSLGAYVSLYSYLFV